MLMNYSWPGNVRELENAIEHAIVMGSTDVILPEDLPEALLECHCSPRSRAKYYDSINQLKRKLILDAIEEAGSNFPEAAKLLGIHPNYLHRLVRNFDVEFDHPINNGRASAKTDLLCLGGISAIVPPYPTLITAGSWAA